MVLVGMAVVAGSLFLTSLAQWRGSDAGAWRLIVSICCAAGAVGVIWLGWYWLKLFGEITSIAGFLRKDKSSHIKPGGSIVLNELRKAINSRFSGNSSYIGELEKQIKDSQIKIQLLRRQKKNTEAIIYSIHDAVIVVDESDKLLMANEAAGELFGFDFKSSQYKSIGELIKNKENGFVEFLAQCRQSKALATRREIALSKDDEPKIFDCIVSCVYDETEDEKKQVCGVVAVLHDITREKEISQMKNDFVSHVSHELKTPLASIAAYSEMLCDGEADDEQTRKEFYSVIQTQAKRLNRLIEDILNTSRIESGLIKVEKKPVSLALLIEEQLQMIKSYAEEKDIEIIEPKSKDRIVFGQVYVDKDMISQVIVNLLSNAVKYTPAGGSVKIETDVDEVAGLVRVNIADTGVGIPEDELGQVFDKFYRVGKNKSQAKGTGLGLNLVKQIVEKIHDGKVFVTSEVGVGSTFGFELPLATEVVESGA
jgi:two-component system phosphate regulon sensor histidine kinase PhoR